MVRGLAALEVVLYHLRLIFLVSYPAVEQHTLVVRTSYFLAGMGHQAVMLFFVLSGLLIGPGVIESVTAGKWSWRKYAVNRTTRLCIVLFPVLLMTAALDGVGERLPGSHVYFIPTPNDLTSVVQREGLKTMACNALYLQSIYCESYGADPPLWSLNFEFWYYVLFPLLVWTLAFRTPWGMRIGYAIALAGVSYFVGSYFLRNFPIWLAGVAVALWYSRKPGGGEPNPAEPNPRRWVGLRLAVFGAAFLAISAVSIAKGASQFFHIDTDYLVALPAALFVATLLRADGSLIGKEPGGIYYRLAHWIAGFSYTLYLLHYPILIFIRAVLHTERTQPSVSRTMLQACIGVVTVGLCYLFSRLTEAHTAKVRGLMLG